MLICLQLLLVEGGVVLRGRVQGVQTGEPARGLGGGGEAGGLGRVEGGRHQGGQVRVGLGRQTRGGEGGKTRECGLCSQRGGGWEVAGAVQSCEAARC